MAITAGVVAALVLLIYGVQRARETSAANEAAAVEAALTPAQMALSAVAAEEKRRKEADFQFAVAATKAIKASLKNPASFELVGALLVDGGAMCVQFRGANSFNAIVTQHMAVRRDFKSGIWNKDCAHKPGEDMMLVKHAL